MVTIVVSCRYYSKPEAIRRKGLSTHGHQRYRCENCKRTFQLDYNKRAYQPGIKEQVIDMAGPQREWHSGYSQSVAHQHEHNDEHT